MTIERRHVSSLMSQIVVHNGTVYLAGQVFDDPSASVRVQTRKILEQIELLLAEVGASKAGLLQATIWLADVAGFEEMNAEWQAWLAPGAAPVRATVGATLVKPAFKVEISVTAALSDA